MIENIKLTSNRTYYSKGERFTVSEVELKWYSPFRLLGYTKVIYSAICLEDTSCEAGYIVPVEIEKIYK